MIAVLMLLSDRKKGLATNIHRYDFFARVKRNNY